MNAGWAGAASASLFWRFVLRGHAQRASRSAALPAVANPAAETKTHRTALTEFRKQLGERFPKLDAETGLMALHGKLETIA